MKDPINNLVNRHEFRDRDACLVGLWRSVNRDITLRSKYRRDNPGLYRTRDTAGLSLSLARVDAVHARCKREHLCVFDIDGRRTRR